MKASSQNKPLFVGIDVSHKRNEVCFLDIEGEKLSKKTLCYPNSRHGAEQLEAKILELVAEYQFNSIRIGMEATNFYHWHLAEFLAESEKLSSLDTNLYCIDPRRIQKFKKSYAREDKADPFDAFVIADFVRFNRLPQPYRSNKPTEPLRHLTRYRYHLVRTMTREMNFFISRLFVYFSGFQQNKPLSKTFGATAEAIFENLTPDEICTMSEKELVNFVVTHGKNRFPDPQAVSQAIQRAARESYRLRPALAQSVQLVLASTLQNLRAMRKALREIDKAIASELHSFPNTLESIQGIGPVYAAGIFAEIGNVKNFPSNDQIAKMAGLVWPKNDSGEFHAEDSTRAIHGNKYLLYYLVEAANALRVHNAEYRAYYNKKVKEVKKHAHKRALVLTARKLVRLVFALLKKNQLYSPSYHIQHPAR